MALLIKLKKLFKLGPKPEEMRRCEDCRHSRRCALAELCDLHCMRLMAIPFSAPGERKPDGLCGPRGKYWEKK